MLKIETDTALPLRDAVYKSLRDAILRGELKPGTRLMEIHLASEIGVSRTPVREAIRMLEQEGLAVTYPRKGAQVMRMTIKDLEDVLELREALDVMAVKKACENITETELRLLEDSLSSFEEVIKNGDVRKIVESDEHFHGIIYKAANNPKLTEIVTSLREQMYRYRYEYIKEQDKLKLLFEEHKKIVEGLKKRDKAFVADIMRVHLENQSDSVKKLIMEQEKA